MPNSGDTVPRATLELALDTVEHQLARVAQLTAAAQEFATVIEVTPPPEPRRDPAAFCAGARTRILVGNYRGMYGAVLNPPDQHGTAIVKLDQGEKVEVFIGDADPAQTEAEVVGEHGRAIISHHGTLLTVDRPPELKLKPGDTVTLNSNIQIVGIAAPPQPGEIAVVETLLSNGTQAEVSFRDGRRIIDLAGVPNPQRGDRLQLDSAGIVALANLGSSIGTYRFAERPNTSWSSIIGTDEATALLRKLAVRIFNPARSRRLPKGILLLGPPGCGKTLNVRAFATELLQRAEGRGAESCFLVIRGPELLQHLLGMQEASVRQVFAEAREHRRRHGYPAVIYITECESILKKRGTGIGTDFMDTLVPAFLIEMDGLSSSDAIVICDTNRPDILDPAITRPGRLDRKVYVGRPNQTALTKLFALYLKQVAVRSGLNIDELATQASAELFDNRYAIFEVISRPAENTERQTSFLTLGHLASGALVENIITQGAPEAAETRLNSDNDDEIPIIWEDIQAAIASAHRQQLTMNMDDDLQEFLAKLQGKTESVHRVRQTIS